MQVINAIRFYSAFKKLQNGDSIEDILYSLKIESISYFYKMFKKYFNMRPSEVKRDTSNIQSERYLQVVSHLSCNIERYNFYKSNLNEGLAQLMSHEDFKEITHNKINLELVKDAIWRYNFY
jgi:AraC-like DNA-binding protein